MRLRPLFPYIGAVPHGSQPAVAHNGLADELLVLKQLVRLLAFVQPLQQCQRVLVLCALIDKLRPPANGTADIVELAAGW